MPDSFAPDDALELLVELIQNACVNTGDPGSGGEIRSVETLQRFMGQRGTVVEPLPGRASVIFRHEGSDPEAPVLLLIPHLDVVPAQPAQWTYDPFGGVRAHGFVWGRGAVDMLNVTAAMAVVFKGIVDGLLPQPVGDVIYAGVADEEAGGTYGAAELVANHWPLVECDFVLTEVAGPRIGHPGATVIPVTVAEKGPAWRKVTAGGVAGHGSQPYRRDNAVITLAEVISRVGSHSQPVLITDEWRACVPYLPLDAPLAERLVDPDRVDGAIDEIAATDEILARWIHACTHLTFSPNVVHGGTKSNVVPDGADADIDVRLLPGQDAADIADHLRKVLGPDLFDRVEITPVLEMDANGSAPEGPLWEAIADASEIHTGNRTIAPTLTPVTTDARFFREKGIPAYGVGLFDDSVTFAEMLGMFHGADERVSEASVVATVEFLATVVKQFSERTTRSER
jgi:acetylornithine deacetylase/succinyl-diaminopimelate desuccinylase-like protein